MKFPKHAVPLSRAEVEQALSHMVEESIADKYVVVHGTVSNSEGFFGHGAVVDLCDEDARGLLRAGVVRPLVTSEEVLESVAEPSAEDSKEESHEGEPAEDESKEV
jgi:hypothetical protein